MIAMAVIPYFGGARPTNTAALILRRIDAGAQFHQRRGVIVLWRLSHAMMQTIYRLTKSLPRKCLSPRTAVTAAHAPFTALELCHPMPRWLSDTILPADSNDKPLQQYGPHGAGALLAC